MLRIRLAFIEDRRSMRHAPLAESPSTSTSSGAPPHQVAVYSQDRSNVCRVRSPCPPMAASLTSRAFAMSAMPMRLFSAAHTLSISLPRQRSLRTSMAISLSATGLVFSERRFRVICYGGQAGGLSCKPPCRAWKTLRCVIASITSTGSSSYARIPSKSMILARPMIMRPAK